MIWIAPVEADFDAVDLLMELERIVGRAVEADVPVLADVQDQVDVCDLLGFQSGRHLRLVGPKERRFEVLDLQRRKATAGKPVVDDGDESLLVDCQPLSEVVDGACHFFILPPPESNPVISFYARPFFNHWDTSADARP